MHLAIESPPTPESKMPMAAEFLSSLDILIVLTLYNEK